MFIPAAVTLCLKHNGGTVSINDPESSQSVPELIVHGGLVVSYMSPESVASESKVSGNQANVPAVSAGNSTSTTATCFAGTSRTTARSVSRSSSSGAVVSATSTATRANRRPTSRASTTPGASTSNGSPWTVDTAFQKTMLDELEPNRHLVPEAPRLAVRRHLRTTRVSRVLSDYSTPYF
jgi:hypothetical protein